MPMEVSEELADTVDPNAWHHVLWTAALLNGTSSSKRRRVWSSEDSEAIGFVIKHLNLRSMLYDFERMYGDYNDYSLSGTTKLIDDSSMLALCARGVYHPPLLLTGYPMGSQTGYIQVQIHL